MIRSTYGCNPKPEFKASNLTAIALLHAKGRDGQSVFFTEPGLPVDGLTAVRSELLDYAHTTNTAAAVVFRGWRRLQALYTAKVQHQTVDLPSALPLETPIVFRDTPPLPTLRPEVPAGWTAWEMSLEQLDVGSLQDFVEQIERQPGLSSRFKYDLLGNNSGQQTFNLLAGFAELKLATG